ncbi:hypothetical protein OIU77_026246 [Salix suchowensis]|uniref:Uncharacterized protein n=1 Tax=Salix suchowensis TaxID=1278906 RepID=A0ABQ9BZ01_9ROSI|nr:hypothetical protein OIU77_026246 [Salix suchowensis]
MEDRGWKPVFVGRLLVKNGYSCNPVIAVHISDVELKVKDSWENGVCDFDKPRIVIPGDLKQRIMAIPTPTVSDLQSFLPWIAVNQHNEEHKEEDLSLPINSLRYLRGLALHPTLLKKPISTALWPDKFGPSWDLLLLFRFERGVFQGFGGCNMHISGTHADHFAVGFTGFETNLLPRLLSFKSCLQLAWEQGFMGVFCNPVLQRLPTQLISNIEFHKYKALVCEIKCRLSREWALPYLQGRQRLC